MTWGSASPPCHNWSCNYAGRTECMFRSLINENEMAVRRGDKLSQEAAQTYDTGYESNFVAIKIIAQAGRNSNRALIETRFLDGNSINQCIDLSPAYRILHSFLQTCVIHH
uniref:Uncharacterized protein n=1 Tax=Schistocephalus solidus TaxID=70667 RepID=A0A0X3PSB2_SCHSO